MRIDVSEGATDPMPLILVVDDDHAVSQVISTVLERQGYQVICCADATQALGLTFGEDRNPGLMITDFFMPKISGLELIRRMRQRLPGLKTVLTTGEMDAPEVDDPEARPDGHLSKPFSPRELLECVRALISGTTP